MVCYAVSGLLTTAAVLRVSIAQEHRQAVEFAIDVALPYDLSTLGSGSLAHAPLLTTLTMLLGFFLLIGAVSLPFGLIGNFKREKLFSIRRKRSVHQYDKDINHDNLRYFDDPSHPRWNGLSWYNFLTFLHIEDGFDVFPSMETKACRDFLVCEIHRHLTVLPNWTLEIIRLFSQRMQGMENYSDAIRTGLQRFECMKKYVDCPFTLFDMVPFAVKRRH